jgi:hypothetical protein
MFFLKDFSNTLRYFNSIVDLMISFESAYLTLWKNSFEEAKGGFREHLLIKHEKKYTFSVNANEA